MGKSNKDNKRKQNVESSDSHSVSSVLKPPPQNVLNFSSEIETITSTTQSLGQSPQIDLFSFVKVKRDATGKYERSPSYLLVLVSLTFPHS